MAGEWYNLAEAKAILENVTAKDAHIAVENDRFVWALREDLDRRLEVLRYQMVDEQVGYKLDNASSFDEEDRWYDEEEKQVSISDRLFQIKKDIWGDPNELLSYGPEVANHMWKKDPMVIRQIIQRKKDIIRVQRELEKAGRL